MNRQDLNRLMQLVWLKKRSGASGEIDEMIRPLYKEMLTASAAIEDTTLRRIFVLHCSGVSPRKMQEHYNSRYIYDLIKKAERIVTGDEKD